MVAVRRRHDQHQRAEERGRQGASGEERDGEGSRQGLSGPDSAHKNAEESAAIWDSTRFVFQEAAGPDGHTCTTAGCVVRSLESCVASFDLEACGVLHQRELSCRFPCG